MACASQSMLSANSSCNTLILSHHRILKKNPRWFKVKSSSSSSSSSSSPPSSSSEEECNVEECAPDKEVGKVSMEWLAGEKTKVAGTFPPKKKGWTGYVEKDTAGQTNIYSVEPAIYVAESGISSGSAGTSSDGAENTVAIAAGFALIALAAASSILLQVDKKAPQVQSIDYNGPPLSYYINKFKPAAIVEATVAPEPESSPPTVEASVSSSVEVTEGKGEVVDEVKVEVESSAVSDVNS